MMAAHNCNKACNIVISSIIKNNKTIAVHLLPLEQYH